MTKEVTLSIGERVAAIGLLNEGKFSNSGLAAVLGDIKQIAVIAEEWVGANLVKTPTDEAVAAMTAEEKATVQQTWNWTDTEAQAKTVTLEQETVDFLRGEVKRKGDANELRLTDSALLTLDTKLA